MCRRIVIYSSFVSRIWHDNDPIRCIVHRSIIRIVADIPDAHSLLPLRPLVCHPERSFSRRPPESSGVHVSARIRQIVPFPVRSLYESGNCGTSILIGELRCRFSPLHDEVGPGTPVKRSHAVTHSRHRLSSSCWLPGAPGLASETWENYRPLFLHHRQDQGAWMRAVVEDGVGGLHECRVGACVLAGVQVAVEAGEIAAAHFQADAVALEEDVAG